MSNWLNQHLWQPVVRACKFVVAKAAAWLAPVSKETIQAALVVCAVTAVIVGAFALACKYIWFLAAILVLTGLVVLLRLAERCLLAI